MSRNPQRTAIPATAILILLTSATLAVAQSDAQIATGRRLIESQQKAIFFAMHPTATLKKVSYDRVRKNANGFVLSYTFHFGGFGGDYRSAMDFTFTDSGTFNGLETNGSSSLVPPFAAADLAMDVLKEMAKEDFEVEEDGAMAKAIEAADSKLVLQLMLIYKQANLSDPDSDKELIKLINGSESMDDKERKYWINILPRMNESQRAELKDILVKERDQLAAIDRKYAAALAAVNSVKQELNKGYSLLEKEDYRAAVSVLSKVIKENPKNGEAYFLRAQAYASLYDNTAAIADFTTVIDLQPQSEGAYRRRAGSHVAAKNYREAYLDYYRSVELAPDSALAANNLAWYLATCPESRFRDGEEAVKHATKACQLSEWKEYMYYDTLAAAYAEQGDFDKAVSWQTRALKDLDAFEKAVGKEELKNAQTRLQLFKAKKAYRE